MRQRESFKMIASSFFFFFFNLGSKKNVATNNKKDGKEREYVFKKYFP